MHRALTSVLFLILGSTLYAQELTIPDTHPRIWWNESTFETALNRFNQDPFEPRAKGDFAEIENGGWKWNNEVALENALYYLFTGDQEAARTAIAWSVYNLDETLEQEMDEEGISCDRCRWWLQEIIIVYDWCYDALSDTERAYFLTEISNVVDRWNSEKRWGTPDEPASNYNQGYMRNSFLWGVASMGENEKAQEYIDHALNERWANFEHYFDEENRSGIPSEGTSYGHTLLNYMPVMFETARNIGLDFYLQHPFFRKAVMFAIYHTTPGPTNAPAGNGRHVTFPFGDASAFWDGRVVVQEFSPFMFYAAHHLQGTHLSALIYDWAEQTGVVSEDILLRYMATPESGDGMKDLPLDYYPPDDGTMGQAFSRTSWDANASAIHFQLIAPELGGHEHQDGLSFSWWRKGSFLTMEVPGRGFGSGYQVPDYTADAPTDVQATIAHNSLLFGAEGQPGTRTKAASVLRLQSGEDFFYAAVDGTNSYKSENEEDVRYNNEFVDQVIREYLFIKPLEVLLVLDRMQSNEESGDFRKTFVMHLLGEPVALGSNDYLTEYQGQSVYVKTLYPEEPEQSVLYEGTYHDYYQDFHRLQVETAQSRGEYFLHVMQVRDAGEGTIDVAFSESENSFAISISHETKGFARVLLTKGLDTPGGAFAWAPDALPQSMTVLHDSVQLREVTTSVGFKWLNLDGSGGTVLSNDKLEKNIVLRPNPSQDKLFIMGLSEPGGVVEIINYQGQVVQTSTLKDGSIDVSHLAAGVYLIRITLGSQASIRRWIKE